MTISWDHDNCTISDNSLHRDYPVCVDVVRQADLFSSQPGPVRMIQPDHVASSGLSEEEDDSFDSDDDHLVVDEEANEEIEVFMNTQLYTQ